MALLCDGCSRADVSCPVWPSTAVCCVEFIEKGPPRRPGEDGMHGSALRSAVETVAWYLFGGIRPAWRAPRRRSRDWVLPWLRGRVALWRRERSRVSRHG